MSGSAALRFNHHQDFAGFVGLIYDVATGFVFKHSPHDVIDKVAIAGSGPRQSVFVISRYNLLRACKGGGWQRLTTGLSGWKISSLVVSPAFDVDKTLFATSFGGGVFRSRDGGLSWDSCPGVGEPHIIFVGLSQNFADNGLVFALGLSGEIYRSSDAGDTWCAVWTQAGGSRQSGLPSDHISDVLIDPLRDAWELWKKCNWIPGPGCMAFAVDAVVVGTSEGELVASRDQGATWKRLGRAPRGARITCIEVPEGRGLDAPFFVGTDTAGVLRVSNSGTLIRSIDTPKSIRCVTALGSIVDKTGKFVLVACGWNEAVLFSGDDGASWAIAKAGLTKHRQAQEPRYGAPHFRTVALPRGASCDDLYLGGFDGLFRAHELGQSWQTVETLPLADVLGVAVGPSALGKDPPIAVATYGAGVYVRSSGADTWRVLNQGLDTLRLGTIAFSPNWKRDRTVFTVCERLVLRSVEDGPWSATPLRPQGASSRTTVEWFNKLRGVERLLAKHLSGRLMIRIKDVVQFAAMRLTGQVNSYIFPTLLVFSASYASDNTLFVGTRGHGIFRSRDGGSSFHQLWDAGGMFVSSLGLSNGPARDGQLFASLSDGLHRSDDGGVVWHRVSSDPPFHSARVAVSPRFEQDRTVFVGGRQGLLRSRDGGNQWRTLEIGAAGDFAIGGLAVSPAFGTDSTLLVHVQGRGLYRSLDGGDTFEKLPWDGPTEDHAFTPLNCFPDSNTLFQFSPDFAEDRTIAAAAFDQIYISRDGGLTWVAQKWPTRIESSRREIAYSGRWTAGEHEEFSAKRAHHSHSPKDTASLRFVGSRVTWIGTRGPDHGLADVSIDGEKRAVVDLFAPTIEFSANLFSMSVPIGEHEIVVSVKGTGSERSAGSQVWIDAFDIERSV